MPYNSALPPVAPGGRPDEDPDKTTPAKTAQYWKQQIDLAEKDHREWRDAAENVLKRYKSQKGKSSSGGNKRLNIFYSNVEHLMAALYGRSAIPDVRRRFGQDDKVGATVAEVIEKSLVYCSETYDSDKPIELALKDYLTVGRGVIRVCYKPEFGQGPDGQEIITEQHLYEEYVYWEDFLCMPCRVWADIQDQGWISFRKLMTKADLRKNFPDVAEDVQLDWEPKNGGKEAEGLKKAEIFEIWDVTDRRRYWISKQHKTPLRIDEDPYGLEGFFPLTEPISHYTTTDTIVPEPEFHVYQDQADDLDEIVGRISRLTKALKRRGVYDASIPELLRLAQAGDNQYIPIPNMQSLTTKGGLANAFQSEDISLIAQVLLQLYQQREMLVRAIWEIVGIADIQRGTTDPSETLGAQRMKAQFGGQRMQKRQRQIQKWVAGLLKLKAEIIAEHFEPERLEAITGITIIPQDPPILPPPSPTGDPQQDQMAYQQWQQRSQQMAEQAKMAQQESIEVMRIMRTDKLRSYRIDVETDSTIFEDAETEKKSRGEMITAITGFIQGWGPMVDAQPALGELAFELMKFGVGGFKSTRSIDDAIEKAAARLAGMAEQGQNQPPPEQQKMMAEMQMKQAEQQGKQAEMQMKGQMEMAKLQAKLEADTQKAQMEMAQKAAELQYKQQELELKLRQLEAQLQFKEGEMRLKAADQMSEHALKQQDFALNQAARMYGPGI